MGNASTCLDFMTAQGKPIRDITGTMVADFLWEYGQGMTTQRQHPPTAAMFKALDYLANQA